MVKHHPIALLPSQTMAVENRLRLLRYTLFSDTIHFMMWQFHYWHLVIMVGCYASSTIIHYFNTSYHIQPSLTVWNIFGILNWTPWTHGFVLFCFCFCLIVCLFLHGLWWGWGSDSEIVSNYLPGPMCVYLNCITGSLRHLTANIVEQTWLPSIQS